jgi:predicted transposase/invertase (TIGR01784 family)
MTITDKYIDPFTDFGFKRIFGVEKHKHLLISFLNDLIDDLESKIVDVEYRNLEKLGVNISDRKAVFDIFCTDENGDSFIVELQRAKQTYFKDRSIYYTSFPIQEQAKKGDWDYNLSRIYFIGILEFNIDDDENYIKKVSLIDEHTNKKFYDKLTYYYIEMPKFKKTEEELSNHLDIWLYILNNMIDLTDIPQKLKDDKIIQEVFDIAEFLKLSKDEQFAYQHTLKVRLDNINTLRYAIEEGTRQGIEKGIEQGIEQGIEKGKKEALKEMVKTMLKQNIDKDTISTITNLTIQEIQGVENE